MRQPRVSVIIPVYNLEPYLSRCLDSVVGQTLKDIEVICINDGSTDRSLDILRQYEKEDPRIRIVDKENGGQGLARNIGIEMAEGEYIGFVDGDDRIEADMYERMYSDAKKNDADLQICFVKMLDEEGNDIQYRCDYAQYLGRRFNDASVFNRHDIPDEIFRLNRYSVNKIYKRAFLKKNNIFFSLHRQFEDHVFHFMTFIMAERISVTREFFYTYYKYRQGSSTAKKDRPLLLFDVISHVQKTFDDYNVEKALIKRFDNFKIRWSVAVYYMAHRDVKEKYFTMMKSMFGKLDIRGNPYIGPTEKLFYLFVTSMPHGLYRYTDAGITLYIHLFNRSLKKVMKPFGR